MGPESFDPFSEKNDLEKTQEMIMELPEQDDEELFETLLEVFSLEDEQPTENVQRVIDEINDRLQDERMDTESYQDLKHELPEGLQDFLS